MDEKTKENFYQVKKYKKLIKEFFKITGESKIFETMINLNLIENTEIHKKQLSLIKEYKVELRKKLDTIINNIKKGLKEKIDAQSKIYLKCKNYQQFKKIITKTKKLLPKIAKIRSEILDLERKSQIRQFQAKIENLKTLRVRPSDYLKIETNLIKLGEIKKLETFNFQNDIELNQNRFNLHKPF